MQAGGQRFDSVYLHQPYGVREGSLKTTQCITEVFLKEKQGKKKNSDREKEKDRNLKREWKRRKKLCIIHSQYCA